ncbi:uncharacterized protein N7473_004426 [Penicillium subrubescens]|uniref:uncharacterized protein n=1 Tax=Penicillium subrubescens TaxID=1316194 RepID=UPI002545AC35|nr:uncharacterized protein N7473_004426 [Penicillium subrubescens]KAJ5900356.1 hypothetical protein N7473_004426 [Penicillium subrubescens]
MTHAATPGGTSCRPDTFDRIRSLRDGEKARGVNTSQGSTKPKETKAKEERKTGIRQTINRKRAWKGKNSKREESVENPKIRHETPATDT